MDGLSGHYFHEINQAEKYEFRIISLIGEIPITKLIKTAEVPIVWPSDANSQLIGKDPDAGKD